MLTADYFIRRFALFVDLNRLTLMLKEIRKQPEHIRSIFMWLSVFIVFSLVFFFWLNGFQKKLVSLLNPAEQETETVKEESPFTVIINSLNDMKATILDLFYLTSGTKSETEVINNLEQRRDKIEPKLLPVSDDKE